MRIALWGLVGCLTLGSACDETADTDQHEDDDSSSKKKRKKKKKKAGATTASAATAASAKAADRSHANWKFVRERPTDPQGMDACAYTGGLGFACIDALLAETNPAKKRYMRLLTHSDARASFDELKKGNPGGVAHAEIAMMCADSGPCKQKGESGDEMDDGYACLTKAESLHQEGDSAASAAHKRACACDHDRAQIPVMGGMLACDGKDKPVNRGTVLTTEQAKQVEACSTCDPKDGPSGCAAIMTMLERQDPEVVALIDKTVVPRCQQP